MKQPAGNGFAAPPAGLKPEINITPLVDVVLVLLIIFMVIAPQMQAGQPVAMAEVRKADEQAKGQFDPITVSVTRDGSVWLEKERVRADADLVAGIAAVRASGPERRVVLQADRDVPFKEVRRVFKVCQDAGVPGVALKVSLRQEAG